ncbi:MAG: amidohydrolase family protein [Actinomycetia bacterium]|nr:amidohydrolase family protein [Actinomycetes bacterium]
MADITIFTARRVRTMEASLPTAEAVAVRDGKILEVGTLETMRPWLDRYEYEIDDTFADHVIMPGLIDPHLHPSMAAILLPMEFTTATNWSLPWEEVGAVRSRVELLDRLVDLDTRLDPDEPLFAWGHHPIWHGDIDRDQLNGISTTRPIIVWHRGYHSFIVNDACFEWMGVDMDAARRHPQVDTDRGAFFETGLGFAFRYMNHFILGTERFRAGLDRMRQVIHHGGQTTIGDAALGMYGFEKEWDDLKAVMERPDTPFRTQLLPFTMGPDGDDQSDQDMVDRFLALPERNTHRLRFSNHVKMFADGGFFAELLQLGFPGHLDGRHGEWMTPPERFEQIARALWNAGLNIHVHCSGDNGVELALQTLEKLQWERPRFDHRFTFEHFGVSRPQQVERLAALGAQASVQVYYVYELSRAFADNTLGYERASQMSRVGSLERAGVRFAVHSDFTMAPAKPLNNAWVAANRINESGEVMGANERASLDAAIKAITTNAAYMLGLEGEVGSLRWGKKADFTILDADPYDVGADGLNEIPIWGTVFEGEKFPITPLT